MPVQSVTESYEGSSSTTHVDLITLRANIDDVRYFDVLFTPGETAPVRRIMAKVAVDPNDSSRKIPQPWDQHPADPWLFVTSITASQGMGAYRYRVAVNYISVGNPLELPKQINWSFAQNNEPVDRDNKGVPITTSAAESFDPPLRKDVYDLVLRIKRNEQVFDELLAATYIGAVNGDNWTPPNSINNYLPGLVKCSLLMGEPQRAADLFYSTVNYEFRFRLAELKVDGNEYIVDSLGWKRKVLDQGFRTLKLAGGAWAGEYDPILDSEGNPVREAQLLDGKGQVLAEEDDPGEDENGNAEHKRFKGTFLVWDLDHRRNFSDLNLV